MSQLLSPAETARLLPFAALEEAIASLLADACVEVPPRLVQPLAGGGSLFVMPACDGRVAITKLITFTPANGARGLPAIQGDVVVFDVATGRRELVLDGPTVTARRTAAVSLLAARRLAPSTAGPLLVVGAGVQGKAHLQAFAEGLGVREVVIASRSPESARSLAEFAGTLGMAARVSTEPDSALAECPLAVTCTPASGIVVRALPRPDGFIAAVGAFTPRMVELSPEVCRHFASEGRIYVDTVDAQHEAGDLIQAGLDVSGFHSLADVVREGVGEGPGRASGPVLFKSCGWAGWDLAAARTAVKVSSGSSPRL